MRKITLDDLNSVIRSLHLNTAPKEDLRQYIADFNDSNSFAQKVVVEAARHVLKSKMRAGLLKNPPRSRERYTSFVILRGHRTKKDYAIFNAGKSKMKELTQTAKKLARKKNEAIEIHRERRLKTNPAPKNTKIAAASRLLEDFSGHVPHKVKSVRLPVDSVGLAIGPVLAVAYETTRDGKREKYLHEFRRNARPLLAASSDGRSLYLLGGAYRFTERGIVDKSSR